MSKKRRSNRGRVRVSKSFYKFLTFGVVMYIVFLFATLPANTVYAFFIKSSPQLRNVKLTGLSGTIWSGLAADANINNIELGKLEWDMHVIPLLIGRVSFDMKFKSLTSQGHGAVAASLGGKIFAENLELRAPMSILTPFMYGYPISLDGQLAAHIKELEIEPGSRLNISGRVVAMNAASLSPQRIEFGDHVVKLSPNDMGSKINIVDQGGALLLQGNVNVQGSGKYNVNLTMAPREDAAPALVQSMKFLGRADAAGKYYFRKQGKLRGW